MEVGSPEFLDEAKRLGLTGYQYYRKLVQENVLPNPTDVEIKNRDNLAKKKGFKSHKDKGYINYCRTRAERRKSNNKDVKSHKAIICRKNANIDTIKDGWIGKGIGKVNSKNVKKSTLNDKHIDTKAHKDPRLDNCRDVYLKSVQKIKVGSPEFIEDAKRLKFKYGIEFYYWLVKKGKLPHPSDIDRKYEKEIAKSKGFRSYSDYRRYLKLGHIDDGKLVKRKRHVERRNSRQQICYRCKIDIMISTESYHHIIPRKFGGSDDDRNRIHLCSTCHNYVEIKTDELILSRNYYNIDLLKFMIANDVFE